MTYKKKAVKLFSEGANCAQAVFAAFAPKIGIDHVLALRLSSSFGGGFGGQREVCGAVSGLCMAAGALYGYDNLTDVAVKSAHYALIQELCGSFRERFGTIICRELLAAKRAEYAPDADPEIEAAYALRPCARLVAAAAEILEEYLAAHPVEEKK